MKKKIIIPLVFAAGIAAAFLPRPAKPGTQLSHLWNKNSSGDCVVFNCEANFTISCNNFFLDSMHCEMQTSPITNSLKHQ